MAEWKHLHPDLYAREDYRINDNSVDFITSDWDYGISLANYISARCKNTEVMLSRTGDYYSRLHVLTTHYNGRNRVNHTYDMCDCSIQVPACLSYENNIYKTFAYIPEMTGIDRNDNLAVATDILDEAINWTPDNAGRALLEDKTSVVYKAALDVALHSLVKYYDTAYDAEFILARLSERSTSSASDDEDSPS